MDNRITAEIQGMALTAVVILFVGTLLALITFLSPLRESALGPLADLTLILSVFAGACLTTRKRGNKGLLRGGLFGLIVFAIILALTLFVDSSLITAGKVIKEIIFSAAAGCLGGILGVGLKS